VKTRALEEAVAASLRTRRVIGYFRVSAAACWRRCPRRTHWSSWVEEMTEYIVAAWLALGCPDCQLIPPGAWWRSHTLSPCRSFSEATLRSAAPRNRKRLEQVPHRVVKILAIHLNLATVKPTMPRYLVEASKRTALCYERVGAQVFEAEDLSSAIKIAEAWLIQWGYTAPSISHARIICGDLIVAEKDSVLSKWILSSLYNH
jgi:hypothetical protein